MTTYNFHDESARTFETCKSSFRVNCNKEHAAYYPYTLFDTRRVLLIVSFSHTSQE